MSAIPEQIITIKVTWAKTDAGTVPLSIHASDIHGQLLTADLLVSGPDRLIRYSGDTKLRGDEKPVIHENPLSFDEFWNGIAQSLCVPITLSPNVQQAAAGTAPLPAVNTDDRPAVAILQDALTSENLKVWDELVSYGGRGESVQKIEPAELKLTFGGSLTPCQQLQRGDKVLVILDLEYLRQDTDGYVFKEQPDGRLVTIQPGMLNNARIMRNPRIDAMPIKIGETVQWQVSTGRMLMSHPPKEQFDLVEGKVIAVYHERKTLTVAKDGDNLELKHFGQVSRPSGVPINWEADRFKDGLSAAFTLNVDGQITGMKAGGFDIKTDRFSVPKAATPLQLDEGVWWMDPDCKVVMTSYPPANALRGQVKAVFDKERTVVVVRDGAHPADLVFVKVVEGDFGRTDLTAPPISWEQDATA